MQKYLTSVLMAVLLLPNVVHASTVNCQPVTTREIAGLFDRWNDTLKTRDADKVAEYYDRDAVLLPTISNKPRTNHEEITQYFVDFLKKNPVGKINQRVIRIGCDWATDTGLYTFELNENGKEERVQARYSFVYEYIGGKWMIVHHHSSVMPEKVDDQGY